MFGLYDAWAWGYLESGRIQEPVQLLDRIVAMLVKLRRMTAPGLAGIPGEPSSLPCGETLDLKPDRNRNPDRNLNRSRNLNPNRDPGRSPNRPAIGLQQGDPA